MCRAVFTETELPSPGLRARLSRRERENHNLPYLPHQQHFHQPTQRVPGSVNRVISRADAVQVAEGNIASSASGKHEVSVAESKTWCPGAPGWKLQAREPGDPIGSSAAKLGTVGEPH